MFSANQNAEIVVCILLLVIQITFLIHDNHQVTFYRCRNLQPKTKCWEGSNFVPPLPCLSRNICTVKGYILQPSQLLLSLVVGYNC